jgi:hypothetical protein
MKNHIGLYKYTYLNIFKNQYAIGENDVYYYIYNDSLYKVSPTVTGQKELSLDNLYITNIFNTYDGNV